MLAAATTDAATDSDVFLTFVAEALVPALRPGQVVVMENLGAHHVARVRELLEAVGCRLVYLSPYLPHLRPIEPMWSKLKQAMRTDRAIGAPLATITADDCRGSPGTAAIRYTSNENALATPLRV